MLLMKLLNPSMNNVIIDHNNINETPENTNVIIIV